MVKGISRQVIVVHAPDQKLFEQAIFILKDDAVENGGVTDEMLQKEREEILSADAEAIRKCAEHIRAFMADEWRCVGGNAEKIENVKELFDVVRPLFQS